MEQHTAKRLRYSFLFLLPAIALLIFVIFVQSQIIFGQAEDMMGETPKEIITPCGENELATLGANGLRCVKAERAPATKDINITTTTCPFGIKNFNIDSSRTLSYTCVKPAVCEENQFLSAQAAQAGQAGPTFTCIGYDIPILKDKLCPLNNKISGFDEEGVPICTPIRNPLVGISCPEGQYIKGVGEHSSLYMIGGGSNSLYVLDTEARGNPARRIGERFGGSGNNREDGPVSITSHNGKLYMIGDGSNALYELDKKATGNPARRIGESFGGNGNDRENGPKSIASHNGKLYMIGGRSDALYVLDTEATGNPARRIGERFGGTGDNREQIPVSIASHNGKLYMIGDRSNALYVLDTEATGNPARRIGENFGAIEGDPTSITSHNGKLYMIGKDSDSLYELNTEVVGRSPTTRIGTGFGFRGTNQEQTPVSIASHNGKLYMIGDRSNALYVLDTEVVGRRNPARKIGESFGGNGDNRENDPVSITSLNVTIATRDPICVNF